MGIVAATRAFVRKRAGQARSLVVRELRANTMPGRAACSLGIGVCIGLAPVYGIQTVLVLVIAFLFRLNRPLALLGGSVTVPPVVPLWLAAGFFTGKIVAPAALVERLLAAMRGSPVFSAALRWMDGALAVAKERLPQKALAPFQDLAGQDLAAAIVQWAIGSSVLALVCGAVTVGVTYPLFRKLRRTKSL